MTSCLLFCTPSPFRKGVYSKRKELASEGSQFFPFRVDPFSKEMEIILTVTSPESVYSPLNKMYNIITNTKCECYIKFYSRTFIYVRLSW